MKTQTNVRLRPATEEDLPLLNAWCAENGIDNLPGIEGVTVAVAEQDTTDNLNTPDGPNSPDTPAGFVRVLQGANGYTHVNPIVVDSQHQGEGIGAVLMQDALQKYKELRLVSRGSSLGFYKHLGAEDIDWEDVDMNVVDDCVGCPIHAECNPQPVRLTL